MISTEMTFVPEKPRVQKRSEYDSAEFDAEKRGGGLNIPFFCVLEIENEIRHT